jgi:hypothetical protein
MLRDRSGLVHVHRDNPVRTLPFVFDRSYGRRIGALAGGEAGTEKQGGEEENSFHGRGNIVAKTTNL